MTSWERHYFINRAWWLKPTPIVFLIIFGLGYGIVIFLEAALGGKIHELSRFEMASPIGLILIPLIVYYVYFPLTKQSPILKLDKKGIHVCESRKERLIEWNNIQDVRVDDKTLDPFNLFKIKECIALDVNFSKGTRRLWILPSKYKVDRSTLQSEVKSFWLHFNKTTQSR